MAPLYRAALAALLFALSIPLVSLSASALVIDDFEAGDITANDTTSTSGATFTEVSGMPSANTVGGVRLIRVKATSTNTASATASLLTTAGPDAAQLLVSGVPDGLGEFDFIYDGLANLSLDGTAGALGLDLSGFDSIVLDATAPSTTATVRLTLWSSATAQNSLIVPLVDGQTVFSLAPFTINMSGIQSIRMTFFGVDNLLPVNLHSIEATAVPEPTTALLLAIGLVGLTLRKRRTR